jgi:hypothetical protein
MYACGDALVGTILLVQLQEAVAKAPEQAMRVKDALEVGQVERVSVVADFD